MESRIYQVAAAAVFLVAAVATAPTSEPTVVKIGEKKPVKFEYGYIVSDNEGNAQGHVQSRDGVYALGRYYVNTPSGSGQKVTYFADDWGYHPLVSYANTSPKGSSRTQFAMGDKAIAALKDSGPASNAIPLATTPSFTTLGLAIAAQGPSRLLVPPTLPALSTASETLIPTVETEPKSQKVETSSKQTILHIPGLRETLQQSVQQTSRENSSRLLNLTAEIGSIGRDHPQEIIRLSSYLQPPDNVNSSYNTYISTAPESLTDEQHQNLYVSASDVYLTTTMKPIVVQTTDKTQFVVTNNNGQTGYNEIDTKTAQSSDSIAVNQPEDTGNVIDQLAPLQAGISILSSESVKPVQESVEGDPVSYKTVVDIQEGISLDVKQDENGNLQLSSKFGDRIPKSRPPQFQGLGYERRLVNPVAQDIVREQNPVVREQKEADFLARQEAEIIAVQKSIQELQEQIISQIDAEHEEVEKKHEPVAKAEALTQDQNSIQSSNTPVHVAPNEELVEEYPPQVPQPVPTAIVPVHDIQPQLVVPAAAVPEEKIPVETVQIDRESVGNNQIEILPHRTVKSQNLAGILTLNPPEPPVQIAADKDTIDLVPPPITDHAESVLLEPYQLEREPPLLPPPSPTLFPVKVETPIIIEKPTVVETTKVLEKPVVVKEPVEHTKIVEIEKPVPVLQPYPVEVTKYVHVDRPVPVPHPVAVSHPIPVPVAVPHAVEVPVPHLIPVPELLPIAVKEYYPIIIHKTKYREKRPKTKQLFTPEQSTNAFLTPEGLKTPQQAGLHTFLHQQGSDLQFSDDGFRHFPEDVFRGNSGQHRNKNVLRNLRIEYGFKPPLRPSVEITEEVKPSIYGPSVRSD